MNLSLILYIKLVWPPRPDQAMKHFEIVRYNHRGLFYNITLVSNFGYRESVKSRSSSCLSSTSLGPALDQVAINIANTNNGSLTGKKPSRCKSFFSVLSFFFVSLCFVLKEPSSLYTPIRGFDFPWKASIQPIRFLQFPAYSRNRQDKLGPRHFLKDGRQTSDWCIAYAYRSWNFWNQTLLDNWFFLSYFFSRTMQHARL